MCFANIQTNFIRPSKLDETMLSADDDFVSNSFQQIVHVHMCPGASYSRQMPSTGRPGWLACYVVVIVVVVVVVVVRF